MCSSGMSVPGVGMAVVSLQPWVRRVETTVWRSAWNVRHCTYFEFGLMPMSAPRWASTAVATPFRNLFRVVNQPDRWTDGRPYVFELEEDGLCDSKMCSEPRASTPFARNCRHPLFSSEAQDHATRCGKASRKIYPIWDLEASERPRPPGPPPPPTHAGTGFLVMFWKSSRKFSFAAFVGCVGCWPGCWVPFPTVINPRVINDGQTTRKSIDINLDPCSM